MEFFCCSSWCHKLVEFVHHDSHNLRPFRTLGQVLSEKRDTSINSNSAIGAVTCHIFSQTSIYPGIGKVFSGCVSKNRNSHLEISCRHFPKRSMHDSDNSFQIQVPPHTSSHWVPLTFHTDRTNIAVMYLQLCCKHACYPKFRYSNVTSPHITSDMNRVQLTTLVRESLARERCSASRCAVLSGTASPRPPVIDPVSIAFPVTRPRAPINSSWDIPMRRGYLEE